MELEDIIGVPFIEYPSKSSDITFQLKRSGEKLTLKFCLMGIPIYTPVEKIETIDGVIYIEVEYRGCKFKFIRRENIYCLYMRTGTMTDYNILDILCRQDDV